MGGFLNGLEQFGKNKLMNSGLGRAYQRYRPTAPQSPMGPPPLMGPTVLPDGSGANAGAGQDPSYDDGNSGAFDAPDSNATDSFSPDSFAGGTIVTSPKIARLGEKGPEAVVPLTPRQGNHMQPDLLGAHLAPPKINGVRYRATKGFSNPAF